MRLEDVPAHRAGRGGRLVVYAVDGGVGEAAAGADAALALATSSCLVGPIHRPDRLRQRLGRVCHHRLGGFDRQIGLGHRVFRSARDRGRAPAILARRDREALHGQGTLDSLQQVLNRVRSGAAEAALAPWGAAAGDLRAIARFAIERRS